MTDNLFNSSLGKKMGPQEVVREITQFIKEDRNRRYKIVIGSDSEGHVEETVDFVTVVVVHRVGNGGRYFWRRMEMPKFHTLRDRIIQEVLLSLDVAKEILSELKKHPQFSDKSSKQAPALGWDFEIHVDIGENGPTKSMTQEVIGMIRAYNFKAKTKPESYAASKVADRHV